MLKFPHQIDSIDPHPGLGEKVTPSQPPKEDWLDAGASFQKHRETGQLRTKDYKPPEPPETDIPIPCVFEPDADLVLWNSVYGRRLDTSQTRRPKSLYEGWEDVSLHRLPSSVYAWIISGGLMAAPRSDGFKYYPSGEYRMDIDDCWFKKAPPGNQPNTHG